MYLLEEIRSEIKKLGYNLKNSSNSQGGLFSFVVIALYFL